MTWRVLAIRLVSAAACYYILIPLPFFIISRMMLIISMEVQERVLFAVFKVRLPARRAPPLLRCCYSSDVTESSRRRQRSRSAT